MTNLVSQMITSTTGQNLSFGPSRRIVPISWGRAGIDGDLDVDDARPDHAEVSHSGDDVLRIELHRLDPPRGEVDEFPCSFRA